MVPKCHCVRCGIHASADAWHAVCNVAPTLMALILSNMASAGEPAVVLSERVALGDVCNRVLASDALRGADIGERGRMGAYLDAAARGGGRVQVTYKQKGGNYGRFYPVAVRDPATGMRLDTSYTRMRSKFRNALAGGVYHDVEMVNAHPVIALQLARRAGLAPESTRAHARLVEDRAGCLSEVRRAYGEARVDHDAAKNLFTRMMFRGSWQRWAKDLALPEALMPAFPRTLQDEIDGVGRALVLAHPHARAWQQEHKPRAPRPDATAFALLCQEHEKDALMAMHRCATGEMGLHVGAWIFDGVLARASARWTGARSRRTRCTRASLRRTSGASTRQHH
jgi:hypothetical protein